MKRTYIVIEDKKLELEDSYSLDNLTPNMRLNFQDKDYIVQRIVPRLEKVENQLFTTVDIFLEEI